MGSLISLPVTSAATFLSSCFGASFAAALGSTFRSVSGASSSFATRLLYAVLLLVNSVVSWISMSSNHTLLWPGRTCTSTGECGFFSVHRLNFALGMLHLLLASLLVAVKSTKDPRAQLQNSWWWLKLTAYVGLVVAAFRIPNDFYVTLSRWVSVPSGALFILIGLVLLVDFAHEWAEVCIQHVEEEDEHSAFWQRFLVIGTGALYAATILMNVAMMVLFCRDSCNMNNVAVALNVVFTVLTTAASLSARIQEYNPRCGLAQSSMVATYCTYLTMSAMASEPDDKLCNPLVRSSGTRRFSVVLGAMFTFIAIAYTTTRAAANSAFQGSNSGRVRLPADDFIEYDGVSGTRSQLRQEALRQAVLEGSLPETVLYENPWAQGNSDEASESGNLVDDERHAAKYNYSLFHLIFFLATQWIAILLTINVTQDDVGDFIPVGRTYFYSWVKIVSAWICYLLYGWTLVAPMLLPERFGVDLY
ncbi:AaceriAGR100Wp [[Ashbya] aceris (nom. inval.)]|nr:AaceriAGR100Wp [[Ashbya] aceris (nom. inval.)]